MAKLTTSEAALIIPLVLTTRTCKQQTAATAPLPSHSSSFLTITLTSQTLSAKAMTIRKMVSQSIQLTQRLALTAIHRTSRLKQAATAL